MKYTPVVLVARKTHPNEAAASTPNPYEAALVIIQPGEDVGEQILARFPEGARNGIIVSVSGSVQNPTFKFPNVTTTHEGCFDITTLACSYKRSENNNVTVTESGMKMVIVNSNNEVYGGRVSGPLIAATTIEVVLLHSPDAGDF